LTKNLAHKKNKLKIQQKNKKNGLQKKLGSKKTKAKKFN